jgi:uncharacterized membrane protein
MTMAGTHDTNGSQGGAPLSLNLWPIIIVNTITIAGMGAVSARAINRIPEGAKIPVHWNFEGVADRFAEAREVLYIMPALAVAMTALFLILPRLDPRRENLAASGKFWNAGGILSVLLIAYVHAIMVMNATGSKIDMISALVPALCVMFAIIGNYLGKTRPNWFGGVRTPWTMSSDYSWEKTHRLAGRLFVLSAVAGLGAWAVLGAIPGMVALVAGVTGGAIISVIASWFYWKRDPERDARGSK